MIFMILSQVIVLLLNLAMLVLSKLTNEFHELIYILPVVGYSICMILFYISYVRTTKRHNHSFSSRAVVISAMVINIMFSLVEIFVEDPENPVMFYITTSVVQVINLMFLFNYMKRYAMRIMGISQQLIHKILSYIFVVLAVLALYCCFVNIFLTVLLLIATSFFAAVASTMFLIAARSRKR